MLVVRLPKRSDVTDLPEPTVFRCVKFGAFKGVLVGIISWPLVFWVNWGLLVNFVFDGVLAASLVALLAYWERWPYFEYKFQHTLSDTAFFAFVSTGTYFALNLFNLFLQK